MRDFTGVLEIVRDLGSRDSEVVILTRKMKTAATSDVGRYRGQLH